VIVQSPFVLLLTWIRLRRGGYQKTLDHIMTGPEPVLPPEQQLIMAKEVAFALAIAVKAGPWRPQCLVRSLPGKMARSISAHMHGWSMRVSF
jgi:hypothetical protein